MAYSGAAAGVPTRKDAKPAMLASLKSPTQQSNPYAALPFSDKGCNSLLFLLQKI